MTVRADSLSGSARPSGGPDRALTGEYASPIVPPACGEGSLNPAVPDCFKLWHSVAVRRIMAY